MAGLAWPDGWQVPSAQEMRHAKALALVAMSQAPLARYYDVRSDFAGATFAMLGDNPPESILPSDLHALTMLSVTVGPRATRRLLGPGSFADAAQDALAHRDLDPSVSLAEASGANLKAMWALHLALKAALSTPEAASSNPWVTASKLSARKRPHLIPVRDNVVGGALGPRALKNASVYWGLFHSMVTDAEVHRALEDARRRLSDMGPSVVVDTSDLRLLDAALWMYQARP